MFYLAQPATMKKQKRRTETAAWWTFIQGKGREGQQMAIGQEALPVADKNNESKAKLPTRYPWCICCMFLL